MLKIAKEQAESKVSFTVSNSYTDTHTDTDTDTNIDTPPYTETQINNVDFLDRDDNFNDDDIDNNDMTLPFKDNF